MLFGGSGKWAAWPCGITGELNITNSGPRHRVLVLSLTFLDVQFIVLSRGLTMNRVRASEQPSLVRSVSFVIGL